MRFLTRRSRRPPVVDGHSEKNSESTRDTDEDPLPPANLEIKRVDYYWSSWSRRWKYRNTGSGVVAEGAARQGGNSSDNDPWADFCFVVVRKLPADPRKTGSEITYEIVIKSPYLLTACKDVIGSIPDLSWTAEPLQLAMYLFIMFFPHFEEYEKTLRAKARTPEEDHVLSSLGVLLDYLRKDYCATLARVANLKAHGEMTYDLLYTIFAPRTVVITECPVTGATRALRVLNVTDRGYWYHLLCESVDSMEDANPGRRANMTRNPLHSRAVQGDDANVGAPPSGNQSTTTSAALKGPSFGRVQSTICIFEFKGTRTISSLEAYPVEYHSDPHGMKTMLLERGRKWASLKGIHHMHYDGTAAFIAAVDGRKKLLKYAVNSRIMIDRGNFIRLNPNYNLPKANAPESSTGQQSDGQNDPVPVLDIRTKHQVQEVPLTEEELILASPILYGFSLSDKIWLEFNVEHIQPIRWHDEAFECLVLAADRKNLLRSLVDAHNLDLGFDDFVQGKGQGLIINLFGPPGVGKTLSAEATSEHVCAPLYVVGAGDLGTKAAHLDAALERVFDIATSWRAIVLIDEADVFLERRSLHDLERNAMVAVFLRHVEYYRGILFLTTNRITAFDQAFLSRIHVALHFSELTVPAKAQVWRAFLGKAGVPKSKIDDALVQKLAERDVNGRQIKNACRTAQSLAVSRGEKLGYAHLTETLDAMEEFTAEFAASGGI